MFDKSYSRVMLIGQINILSFTKPEEAVDAASIMRSWNAQRCYSSRVSSGMLRIHQVCINEIVHRSLR
jgi:hypothetical protein